MARGEQYVWFLSRSGHSDYGHRHPDISGDILSEIGLAGAALVIVMTMGTLSFLVTTPEVWVPTWEARSTAFRC